MDVVKDGEKYVIREADNNKGLMALCDCSFDTYCEVPLIDTGVISIVVKSIPYQLNLNEKAGVILIDTSTIGRERCL